jgi:hypothetical protein
MKHWYEELNLAIEAARHNLKENKELAGIEPQRFDNRLVVLDEVERLINSTP